VFDYDGDYIQTFNTREEADNCLNSLIGANYQLYGRSEDMPDNYGFDRLDADATDMR
jgi:hypothetical protein